MRYAKKDCALRLKTITLVTLKKLKFQRVKKLKKIKKKKMRRFKKWQTLLTQQKALAQDKLILF